MPNDPIEALVWLFFFIGVYVFAGSEYVEKWQERRRRKQLAKLRKRMK